MRTRSIRFRLTAWYAAILTAGLGLFSGLIWLSLQHRLIGDLDRDLKDRAGQFERYFRNESAEVQGPQLADELEEFCQALPPASYVSLSGSNGLHFRYPPGLLTGSAKLRVFREKFTLNQGSFDLEIATPMDEVLHALDLLRLLLMCLIPMVVIVACLGGAWISGRAMKPVQAVTAAALAISIENLSERLPVPDTKDELSRLAEVLNGMLSRLESAVKTLSQFVSDASHELRTPVAVIRTTAELAARRLRPAESYRESLQEIALEAGRMTRLVEDLLSLARSDAGTARMRMEPVNVCEVLADVCAEMRGLADLRRIHIEASFQADEAAISGNRPALHRLFLILLDNALKYSHEGGRVIMSARRSEEGIIVAVEDFGSGIKEADLPHIFKRFYRAEQARSRDGYGLGLPLAESIVRAHRAAMEVHSAEGRGTVFRVIFAPRDAAIEMPNPGIVSSTL